MTVSTTIKRIKDLPSPKGHFILGHLPQFKTDNKHQVLERWVEECGPLFKINFVGKEFIVSAKPDFNTEVLKLRPEKFRRFSKINEIFTEMGIVGVFNAEGDTWKRHRKPTSEALSAKNVKGFFPVIHDKTQNILNKFQHYEEQGKKVGVQKEFMSYTIDITTAIAFGYELDTINGKADSFQRHLETIFPMINQRITAPIPIWRYLKQQKDKQLDSALKAIEKVIYSFINDAKDRLEKQTELHENPTNFLEALLAESKGDSFSNEEVYGNVFSMLLAGEDTTSNSISWAVYYLAQHPEIVAKVRAEALSVYDQHTLPPDHATLAKLKYTNAVAQEAIRLKPTTPQLYMESNEEVTIDGLLIPKKTVVILQAKVAQTEEKYFSNADKFEPERWMKSECPMHKDHSPKVVKAFGGGPRFCPGMNLAMNEMVMLLSTLCKNFDLSLSGNAEDVTEKFAFTMHPDNLNIKLKKIVGEQS